MPVINAVLNMSKISVLFIAYIRHSLYTYIRFGPTQLIE